MPRKTLTQQLKEANTVIGVLTEERDRWRRRYRESADIALRAGRDRLAAEGRAAGQETLAIARAAEADARADLLDREMRAAEENYASLAEDYRERGERLDKAIEAAESAIEIARSQNEQLAASVHREVLDYALSLLSAADIARVASFSTGFAAAKQA